MKKIIIISILTILSLFNSVNAQSPNWHWARSAGEPGNDYSRSVSTDASGNVIMVGYFEGPTITFGSIVLTNTDSLFFSVETFIVKYDANGNVLWARNAGGNDFDYGLSVTTDLDGNIIMTGLFYSSYISFGAITLNNTSALFNDDIFIVKYDPNGNVLWAKSAGGISMEEGHSVVTDATGNVIMSGTFGSPTITFGATTLTKTGINYSSIFIVKYDPNGNVLWANNPDGTSFFRTTSSLATDTIGNIIMTGSFNSPTLTFGTTTLTNAGLVNTYIVKYDSSGNVLWVKGAGGVQADYSMSVATDASGNVFATGSFESPTITFGTTTLVNNDTVNGNEDIFIVKYNTSGNVLWAKNEGGVFNDFSNSVSVDKIGDILIAGAFRSPTIAFGVTTLTNVDTSFSDIFIAKYDGSGNVLWAKSTGGAVGDVCTSVTLNPTGNIFMTGTFESSSISFGTTILYNPNLGAEQIFIAKLDATPVGLEEITAHSDILIAPNPFSSQATITFKEEQKNTMIKISDVLGKEINSTNFSGKQFVLEKEKMKTGIYFVQTIDKNKNVANRKIIVQ